MRQVIHIFGASGSGTSTLGRAIADAFGYTFMDTDNYFWMPTDPPFTTKRPREDRVALMRRDIESADNVVISGSLTDWGDELIPYFTLVIRLVTDTEIRLQRLEAREQMRFGTRLDPGRDMYEEHLKFMAWAAQYDDGGPNMRSKASHDAWQRLLTCPVLTLDGAASIEENLDRVRWTLK